MKVTFIEPNLHGEFRINLGLAALITYIDQRTPHKVDLVDLTFYRKNWMPEVKKKILHFKPDVIGLSTLTYNVEDAKKIISYIKSFYSKCYVVFGGVHPTIHPLETIKCKNIDAICIGEGEYSFTNLLNALESKSSLKGINGIWFKEKNGDIIQNPKSTFIQDLDSLPFIEWTFFDLNKYSIINPYEINILGSRGCPFNCTYCLNTVIRKSCEGNYVRYRSPENIIDEMEFQLHSLKNPYLCYFYFWDDMFNLNQKFVKEFCELIIKRELDKKCTWSCSSRIDTIQEDTIKLMARANMNLTRIGIESGNDDIRKNVYYKNFSNKDTIRAMKILKKYNIHTQADFIIGGPKETIENVLETYALMSHIEPSEISLNVFQPFPKLKATEIFLEDGGQIDEEVWDNVKNFFLKTAAKHNRINWKDLVILNVKFNLGYLVKASLLHLKKQKLRFIFDCVEFLFYLKWKYNFLLHDLFKMTIRKYFYEENIPNKQLYRKQHFKY